MARFRPAHGGRAIVTAIWIVDTSVLLEILDVPGFRQDREAIVEQYERRLRNNDRFQLSMGVAIETGNHIADVKDGNIRRDRAMRFDKLVRSTLESGRAWQILRLPEPHEFADWCSQFPDEVMRGFSLVDAMLIRTWETTRRRGNMFRVAIWTKERRLMGYDHKPQQREHRN